ncbi:GNAT family N-acetyltransferase [Colwellia sp. 6_MG-2023]|uniref:tRNA(Met) cytidine acetyltransferase TmcA n=1 Tax=Colwellia sp. 6_MG-2023 TaxID=3062676 RepID=UPI0026E21577|nr:GNAT family N-acetyltransferase [Colwellia sp. 6_MG-2023]MDO6489411.1 GNAT family N-acetyltransferase [Colwellia sp. 6_MG-2023]
MNLSYMQSLDFSSWFNCYQQQALMLNERRLIVLVGDNAWSNSILKSIDSADEKNSSDSKWLIYGDSDNIEANIAKQRFRDKLGSESNFVIFQDPDLSIDAFACLSGTLVAGGIFFLLINDRSQIAESLFYQRFFDLLKSFPEHVIIEKNQFVLPTLLPTQTTDNTFERNDSLLPYNCVTQEQVLAVDSIIKVFKGKRNKPLVLTADRGRGKSTALAIACAELLKSATKEYHLRLVITSADIESLTVFFNHLIRCLPEGEFQKRKFTMLHGSVEFIAVDQLIKQPVNASVLLVDEAAAIPIYLLEQLLSNNSRLVFATTIHGYEGAGRGFTLKFQGTLAAQYPHWQSLHINEPIRWRINDPLEQLVFDACLLNAELPSIAEDSSINSLSSLVFKQFSATELAHDESLFKQVFSVLVTAHYQTKPSDVKMLLDNEQVQLVCLLSKELTKLNVVAVALLINEGSFNSNSSASSDPIVIDSELVNAIQQSKRRLKNHFVPQSLLTQCGIEYAFDYHYIRIMRIAVHPQLQQQGVGSYFLDKIENFAALQNVDFLASSFGATKPLLSFWLVNNFKLARIGFQKDKASGEQSALVLKALSSTAAVALTDINSTFYRSFEYLLTDEYKLLSAELVALIIRNYPKLTCTELSERDQANIVDFAKGYGQYSSCVFSLHLWLKMVLSDVKYAEDQDLLVFISRIFQKHSINDVCNTYGFTGKKALEQFFRAKVKLLLSR